MNLEAKLARDWDLLAEHDAFRAVLSREGSWDQEAFFRDGEQQAQAFLKQWGIDPNGKRLLEIGSGLGRLSQPLSRRFASVAGVDVSKVMVFHAVRLRPPQMRNLSFHHVPGLPLPFLDTSFDAAFSFLTFQHFPTRRIVASYLKEIHRVLKPGAPAYLQFFLSNRLNLAPRYRLYRLLASLGLAGQLLLRLGLSPMGMFALSRAALRRLASLAGFTPVREDSHECMLLVRNP